MVLGSGNDQRSLKTSFLRSFDITNPSRTLQTHTSGVWKHRISRSKNGGIKNAYMKPVIEIISWGGGCGPRFIWPCTDFAPVNRFPSFFVCRRDLVRLDFMLFFWCLKIHVSKSKKWRKLKKWKIQDFCRITFFLFLGPGPSKNFRFFFSIFFLKVHDFSCRLSYLDPKSVHCCKNCAG